MQGKGGVGKTLVATLIAERLKEQERPLVCYDTDPVNQSFALFRAFDVHPVKIYDGKNVDFRAFDDMVRGIIASNADVVIDNGAASFIPLGQYMVRNGTIQLLTRTGREFYVHTIVTGGDTLAKTLDGVRQLCERMPEQAKIVVWVNEFFGKIEEFGKGFEQTKLYLECKARIVAVVYLRKPEDEVFAGDFQAMRFKSKTFFEALADPEIDLVTQQRLFMMRDDIFAAVRQIPG